MHAVEFDRELTRPPRLEDIVNLERYPIVDLESDAGRAEVAAGRTELARTGLCLLPDFLSPGGLGLLRAEAALLGRGAYYEEQADTHDESGRLVGTTMPARVRSSAGSVPYDRLPATSPARLLYEWEGLVRFVRALLGVERLYRTADPIVSCLLVYYAAGDELGWHFDPNDGVVTLLVEASEQGGAFEFVPDVRGDSDDSRERVARIIGGDREGLIAPPIRPGTLSVFRGTRSLHRVTPVRGSQTRVILTMSFDPEPGVMFSTEIRRRYSGRIA